MRGVGGSVTLVGHSLGGLTVSTVGEQVPELLGGLLYVSAFVPGDGQGILELAGVPEFASSVALRQEIDPGAGTATFPRGAYSGGLLRRGAARGGAPRRVPAERREPGTDGHPGGAVRRRHRPSPARVRGVPAGQGDPGGRAADDVRHRGHRHRVHGGHRHSPFLSRPEEFAGIVERFVAAGTR
nr:alpha/beta fold hydrolase [Pseudonocardia dioxanivorans]